MKKVLQPRSQDSIVQNIITCWKVVSLWYGKSSKNEMNSAKDMLKSLNTAI